MDSNLRVLKTILQGMARQRPVLNPYATPAAAEILEAAGKHNDAAAVRAEIDPTGEQHGMDPLDFWLAVEEWTGATPPD